MPIGDDIAESARARFFAVSANMPLTDVAELIYNSCDLLLVLTTQDRLCGIISKASLIACLAQHDSLETLTAGVAAVTAYSCHVQEDLNEIWRRIFIYGWENLPLLSEAGLPIGTVTARDVVDTLIRDGSEETKMLRQYSHAF
jgi:Mg/Co/Ni transporter MgtE